MLSVVGFNRFVVPVRAGADAADADPVPHHAGRETGGGALQPLVAGRWPARGRSRRRIAARPWPSGRLGIVVAPILGPVLGGLG